MKKHGTDAVFLEGLYPENLDLFEAMVSSARDAQKRLDEISAHADLLTANGRAELRSLIDQHRIAILRLGAAGQLYMEGKITAILPAESEAEYRTANPVHGGRVLIDSAAMERREDAIVRNLLLGRTISIIILGGKHKLDNNLQADRHGRVQYERVTPLGYPRDSD